MSYARKLRGVLDASAPNRAVRDPQIRRSSCWKGCTPSSVVLPEAPWMSWVARSNPVTNALYNDGPAGD